MKSECNTIAVLLTVHNRRDTTMKCLGKLYENDLTGVQLNVYLVDDGSTDGTRESVEKAYPGVNIIEGDGNLFWNRGMWTAWSRAAREDYDFYLWLNDDTLLYDGAVRTMLDAYKDAKQEAVIVGCTCSVSDHNKVTYGGARGKLMDPNGTLQEVDHINGNFVLVSRNVYKKVGNLDYFYTHSFGDWDYGVRALKAGFKLYTTPRFIGTCERHDDVKKCYSDKYGLFERLNNFYSPLGNPPRELFHSYYRERGMFYAIKIVCSNYLAVLCPCLSRKLGILQ